MPAGPGHRHRMPNATPTASSARIRRSRSSTRCATKGCSVPSSSSFGSELMLRAHARWAEARNARGARLRTRAHTGALLVPLRRGTALEAPILLRVLVLQRRRRDRLARRGQAGSDVAPALLELAGGGAHLALHALLDVARGVLELRLHLLQLFELDRAIDLGLHVGHVALRLAHQRADGARSEEYTSELQSPYD